jgi:hypothetical protein
MTLDQVFEREAKVRQGIIEGDGDAGISLKKKRQYIQMYSDQHL